MLTSHAHLEHPPKLIEIGLIQSSEWSVKTMMMMMIMMVVEDDNEENV